MTALAESMWRAFETGWPLASFWPTAPGWLGAEYTDGVSVEFEIGDVDPVMARCLIAHAAIVGGFLNA